MMQLDVVCKSYHYTEQACSRNVGMQQCMYMIMSACGASINITGHHFKTLVKLMHKS